MYKLSRLLIVLAILLAGLVLVPYVALPSERLQWQMFAEAYQPSSEARIKIEGLAFTPQTVLIGTGATVRWKNEDDVAHTVIADLGAFDSGTLLPGERFEYRFDSPGTYTYHCSLHPSMTGTIIVVDSTNRVFLPFVTR